MDRKLEVLWGGEQVPAWTGAGDDDIDTLGVGGGPFVEAAAEVGGRALPWCRGKGKSLDH